MMCKYCKFLMGLIMLLLLAGAMPAMAASAKINEDLLFEVVNNAPEKEWDKTFGGTDYDYAESVQQTSDGGYIIAGRTESNGSTDFWLVKTDSTGTEMWNKTFGGTDFDSAESVQQTSDGGYIIAGRTESNGSAGFWVVKTDSAGTEMWNKIYGGIDYAGSVQQTSDGGYIIAGQIESYVAGSSDFWLVKTDSNGTEMWNKTFDGDNDEYAESVQQTSDGGYIIAGATDSDGGGSGYFFWLVKTDSTGTEMWNKTLGGNDYAWEVSVQQTSDGGYILASTGTTFSGTMDFWLVKTDSNGTEMWNKIFGGAHDEYAKSVQQTSDGGYIIAGSNMSMIDLSDFLLVKTDSNGTEMWNKTFGGNNDEFAESVQQTSDGGYIIAGGTKSYGAGSADFWLVKIGTNTTLPVLTIISPTNGTSTANDTITVTGTASCASGIASVTVNAALASGAADWSTWNAEVTLSEGANIITAIATDNAGNQNTTTITVYLENTSTLSIGSVTTSPNSTVTIPISVANVTNISGISFDVLYNSSVVTVSNISANESFTNSSISPDIDNANGTTNIMLTNSNLISASTETPVINIAFNIIGGSGSSTSLDLQNVEFGGAVSNPYTPTVVVDGQIKVGITVGIKGDFNGNGRVDIGDATKVAFMISGNVPEDLNADFNGNGRVDIGDAAKIAFYLAKKVSEL